MKRTKWRLLLTAVIMAMFMCVTAMAQEPDPSWPEPPTDPDAYTDFTLDFNNRNMIGLSAETEGEFRVPETFYYDGVWYQIDRIRYDAFSGCHKIEKIFFPKSISVMGDPWWEDCDSLMSVEIDKDNEFFCSIDNVIYNKDVTYFISVPTRQTELVFPASVREVPSNVLSKFSWVTRLEFLSGDVTIHPDAISHCESLTTIVIGEGHTVAEEHSIINCPNLEIVDIRGIMDELPADFISYCPKLKEFNIPSGVKTINTGCLSYSGNKENPMIITIPDSVELINCAFHDCPGITEVIWGDQDITFKTIAFGGCVNLTQVQGGNGNVCFDNSFTNTYALKSLTIGDGDVIATGGSFNCCEQLETVVFGRGSHSFSQGAFTYGPQTLIFGDGDLSITGSAFAVINKLETLEFGSGEKTIEGSSFCGKPNLKSIDFKNGGVTLSGLAFSDWPNLESLEFGYGDKSISGNSFCGSPNLKSINFGDGDISVFGSAFCNMKTLQNINFGDGDISLYYSAFASAVIDGSISMGNGKKVITNGAFAGCQISGTVDFGDGDVDISQSGFATGTPGISEVIIGTGNHRLTDTAFGSGLQKLVIEGGTLSLPKTIFKNSSALKELIINAKIDAIPDEFCYNCANLEKVYLPYETIIPTEAFLACTSLTDLTLGEGDVVLGTGALTGCRSLAAISMGHGSLTLGERAICTCKSMHDLDFADKIIFGEGSLIGWNGTATYKIPDYITSIPSNFAAGSTLKTIIVPDSVTTLDIIAFMGLPENSIIVASHPELFIDRENYSAMSTTIVVAPYTLNLHGLDNEIIQTYTDVGYFDVIDLPSDYSWEDFDGNHITQFTKGTIPDAVIDLYSTQYTVTFLDDDGTEISSGKYNYGVTPAEPEMPNKPTVDDPLIHSYKFIGWDKEVLPVTGDAVYTAQYTYGLTEYPVTFLNYDGSVIDTVIYHYEDPMVIPEDPSYNDGVYAYTFTGWDAEFPELVTASAVYTAQYDKEYIEYTISFVDYDGTVLDTQVLHYGDDVTAPVPPARGNDQGNTYYFIGWDPAITPVAGDAVYTAVYGSYTTPVAPPSSSSSYEKTYSVTIGKTEDGKVEANKKSAKAGSEVLLTVKPDKGMEIGSIVTDPAVTFTQNKANVFAFTMPAKNVKVTATFVPEGTGSFCLRDKTCPADKYEDIRKDAWYHDAIHYVTKSELMDGVTETAFFPKQAGTRLELIEALWRLEGCPKTVNTWQFDDVDPDIQPIVSWAVENGLALGYGNGCFGPMDGITREQVFTILYRYLDIEAPSYTNTDVKAFKDANDVSSWARDAVFTLVKSGVVKGNGDGYLNPQSGVTRIELASVLFQIKQANANND